MKDNIEIAYTNRWVSRKLREKKRIMWTALCYNNPRLKEVVGGS